jgi:Icc-related predicted phosphoesterase
MNHVEMPILKKELNYDFQEALNMNNFDQAKNWLDEQKQTILKDEIAWVDELEEKLFTAYLNSDNLEKARLVAEESINVLSRERRLKRLQN